jgi:hypothetical protein
MNIEHFTDVTLATDDSKQIKAHKVILSACSSFFRRILHNNKHPHPLIYIKGVRFSELSAILKFVYQGQTEVSQDLLQSFMDTAKDLDIKGLAETTVNQDLDDIDNVDDESQCDLPHSYEANEVKNTDKLYDDDIVESNSGTEHELVGHTEELRFLNKETMLEIKGNSDELDELKPNQCCYCGKQFNSKNGLKHHIASTHEGVRYPCDQCEYKAKANSHLTRHKKLVHKS